MWVYSPNTRRNGSLPRKVGSSSSSGKSGPQNVSPDNDVADDEVGECEIMTVSEGVGSTNTTSSVVESFVIGNGASDVEFFLSFLSTLSSDSRFKFFAFVLFNTCSKFNLRLFKLADDVEADCSSDAFFGELGTNRSDFGFNNDICGFIGGGVVAFWNTTSFGDISTSSFSGLLESDNLAERDAPVDPGPL